MHNMHKYQDMRDTIFGHVRQPQSLNGVFSITIALFYLYNPS